MSILQLLQKDNSFFVEIILGRGKHSHAYTHSVQVDHHVFLNLHTLKVLYLPTKIYLFLFKIVLIWLKVDELLITISILNYFVVLLLT